MIDIHTHVFPDALAARAIPRLEAEGQVRAVLDGTTASLLASMDAAGIDRSVVLSIATRPEQFDAILEFSRTLRDLRPGRLVPFPSVHPSDSEALARIDRVAGEGFSGLKIHPYYQDFRLDEPRLVPFLERCRRHNLLLLCHTGYDIAFPRDPRATPAQVRAALDRVPGLTLIASHLGAWDDWDEARRHLIGQPVYTDLSYAAPFFPSPERFAELTRTHPSTYLLFGSDSPWGGQAETLEQVRSLRLGPEAEAAVLGGNAERLLRDAGNAPAP